MHDRFSPATRIGSGVVFLLLWHLRLFGQDAAGPATDPLEDFRFKYEAVKAGALEPVLQLKVGYGERLKAELEAAKAGGVLERVQGIMAEIAWIDGTGTMPPDETVPTILRFRNVYLATLKDREKQRIERLEGVLQRSGDLLTNIQKDFTREGKIDRAVATQAFAEEARAEISRLKSALEAPGLPGLKEGETVLWRMQSDADFELAEGCEAKALGGSWTLASPPEQRGHVETREKFEPPFRISTLIASESGDLRFYYGPSAGMEFVLFNWTRNPTTLRLADPSGKLGIISVPDQGFLTVGETCHIEIVVESRNIEVFVNGELRGSRAVDLTGYRDPVGLGPFGTVTLPGRAILEQFVVIRPKP